MLDRPLTGATFAFTPHTLTWQSARLMGLLQENTKLTQLSQRIKELTDEMHTKIMMRA